MPPRPPARTDGTKRPTRKWNDTAYSDLNSEALLYGKRGRLPGSGANDPADLDRPSRLTTPGAETLDLDPTLLPLVVPASKRALLDALEGALTALGLPTARRPFDPDRAPRRLSKWTARRTPKTMLLDLVGAHPGIDTATLLELLYGPPGSPAERRASLNRLHRIANRLRAAGELDRSLHPDGRYRYHLPGRRPPHLYERAETAARVRAGLTPPPPCLPRTPTFEEVEAAALRLARGLVRLGAVVPPAAAPGLRELAREILSRS